MRIREGECPKEGAVYSQGSCRYAFAPGVSASGNPENFFNIFFHISLLPLFDRL